MDNVRKQLKKSQNIFNILWCIANKKYKHSVKLPCIYSYSFLNNNKIAKPLHEKSSEYPIL